VEKALFIAVGGALGALCRYGAAGLVHRLLGASFPHGTLVVNLLGCLGIGILAPSLGGPTPLPASVRLFVAIGFLGAFTTFSTFGYETLKLIEDGEAARGLWNVLLNVILGLACVWLGQAIARATTGGSG
jgi:CrcB protein